MRPYWEFLNKFVPSIYKLSYLQLSSQGDGKHEHIQTFWNKKDDRTRVWVSENPSPDGAGISNPLPSPLPITCEMSLTEFCPNSLRLSQHMKTLHLSCNEVNRLNILQAEVIVFGFVTTLPFRLGHISNSFSPECIQVVESGHLSSSWHPEISRWCERRSVTMAHFQPCFQSTESTFPMLTQGSHRLGYGFSCVPNSIQNGSVR